ncbi:MAG: hypothetical protein RLZZ04_3509 [Cyanobacteriota bacterium]|jgi:hypothetical protein
MPRRREFIGVAHNLNQWILSRNFDIQGYWGVGKLYKFAEENGTSEVLIDLRLNKLNPESIGKEFNEAIDLLAQLLHRRMKSNKMPEYWLQEASVTFRFKAPYQHKYHYWSSALGQPFICSVYIKTDIGSVYVNENGCNCWVHDPKKELRRYGF